MRLSIQNSALALALVIAAPPAFAIDVGASIGGGGSASASSRDTGGSSGASVGGGGSASVRSSADLSETTSNLTGLSGRVTSSTSAEAAVSSDVNSTSTIDSAATETSATAEGNADASAAVSLAGGLAGTPVISADGARVGTVVGVGIDASHEPTILHTNIGGFLGFGSTPVQFALNTATVTEEQVHLQATEAQLQAFIAAEKSTTVNAASTGAGSTQIGATSELSMSAAVGQ